MLPDSANEWKRKTSLYHFVLSIYFISLSIIPVYTRMCNASSYSQGDGMCLWVTELRQPVNYTAAVTQCNKQGGRIVALDSKKKYFIGLDLLTSINHEAWIGLDDRKRDGTYVWNSTGKVLSTADPWVKMVPPVSQPNDCQQMVVSGAYHSKQCTDTEKMIMCEVSGSGCADLSPYCNSTYSSQCKKKDLRFAMSNCRKYCNLCNADICNTNNGDCEHGCMATGKNVRVCLCPQNFTLMNATHCSYDLCLANNGGCEGNCWINGTGSRECGCKYGFEVANETACVEMEPCSLNNGGCDHACAEINGKVRCSCQNGFVLKNGLACKPKTPLLKKAGQYLILFLMFSGATTGLFVYTEREEARMSHKSTKNPRTPVGSQNTAATGQGLFVDTERDEATMSRTDRKTSRKKSASSQNTAVSGQNSAQNGMKTHKGVNQSQATNTEASIKSVDGDEVNTKLKGSVSSGVDSK